MRTEELKKEKKAKTPEQALHSLQAMCARAEKSSGDALRLMTRWGVEKQAQSKVLQSLISDRFIDDARYAACYVREKMRLSAWGQFKIVTELRRKGIDREIIAEAITQMNDAKMSSRLEEELLKYAKKIKFSDLRALRDKLFRRGAALGYESGQIRSAIDKVMAEISNDNDPEEGLDDDQICFDF